MKRARKYFKLKSLKRKNLSRLILVTLLLSTFLVAAFITYSHLLERRVNKFVVETLVNIVEKEYGHAYTVEYQKLAVDVWSSQIVLTDISILNERTETTIPADIEKLSQASAIKIYLDVDGLWRLWLDDYLKINKLTVISPDLDIINTQSSQDNVSTETGDILKVIRKQLDLFSIDLLEIKNAHLTFYRLKDGEMTESLEFPDVSLILSDFEWDTDDKLTKVTSDNFYISLKNQSFILPDSGFQVGFKELSYSLIDNRVKFDEMSIKTLLKDSLNTLKPQKEFINITLPGLIISGVNFLKAYETNELHIDTISLLKPIVDWEHRQDNTLSLNEGPERSKNIVYALSSLFKSVELDYFELQQGALRLELNSANKIHDYKTDELDIILTNLAIDSLIANTSAYSLEHDQMTIVLKNITGHLPESEHTLTIDQILYSTDSVSLQLDSIKIAAVEEVKSPQNVIMDINIPKLTITDFDHLDLLKGILDVSSLSLEDAVVNIKLLQKTNSGSDDQDFSSFDAWMAESFRLSHIDAIKLKNISLNYSSPNGVALNVNGGDLSIDNVDLSDLEHLMDYASNFEAKATYLNLQVPRKKLKVESRNLSVDIKAGVLTANATEFSDESINLNFGQLAMRSPAMISFDKIKDRHIETLSVSDFDFTYNVIQKNKQVEYSFLLDSLNLINGNITMSIKPEEKINLDLHEFVAGGVTYQEGVAQIRRYNLNLGKGSYVNNKNEINLNAVTWNSIDKLLTVTNPTFKMADGVRINSSSLTISELDLNNLLRTDEIISGGQLTLQSPVFQDSIASKTEKKLSDKTKRKGLEIPHLPSIELNKILIRDGRVNTTSGQGGYVAKSINLEFTGIKIDSTISLSDYPSQFLFAKKIKADIDDMSFTDRETNFRLKLLHINSDNTITGSELYYQKYNHDTLQFRVDDFSVQDVAYNSFLLNGDIDVKKLAISDPTINLVMHENQESANESDMPLIRIDEASVKNAALKVTMPGGEKIDLSPVDIRLKGILYDSTVDLSSALIPADFIDFTSQDMEWTSGNGLNKIKIGGISMSHSRDELIIQDIKLKPLYTQSEYMERFGIETDWVSGEVNKVTIHGMNLLRLLKERAVICDKILIEKPVLTVYRDKNLPDEEDLEKKILPGSMLKSLKTPVEIDSTIINNGVITYYEIAEKGSEPGMIIFDNFNASLSNISNTKLAINKNPIMRLNIGTHIMQDVAFNVDFRFHLDDEQDKFEFSGNLAPNEIPVFNPATEGVAFVHIKSGNSKKLDFTVLANDSLGYGTMYFQYNDLKVNLIDKQTNDTKKFEESIASFFANTLLIKKRNLAIIKLRKGDIYFERNQNKSIFNYLSKLFMSGIYSSVGFKNYRKEIRRLDKISAGG